MNRPDPARFAVAPRPAIASVPTGCAGSSGPGAWARSGRPSADGQFEQVVALKLLNRTCALEAVDRKAEASAEVRRLVPLVAAKGLEAVSLHQVLVEIAERLGIAP